MMNKRSPWLTSWPSLKWIESMKPETRARISTVATAVNRPVYSSHSVIFLCSGCDAVTGGGAGAALAIGLLSQPASRLAANSNEIRRIARVIGLAPSGLPPAARQERSQQRNMRLIRPEHGKGSATRKTLHAAILR